MRIISCFGDRTCGTFLGPSDEDNSVPRTDNFVNVLNSVTSPPVLSYHCVLHYFLTMSVGFHLNLTFGLKPHVGGIKIERHCLQTIHFPSWVAHSNFDCVLEIFTILYYAIEESDDVIGGSSKTAQHSIENNSRNVKAVIFKLGTSNVHHKRNIMTSIVPLLW